jgi:hypothetical protein
VALLEGGGVGAGVATGGGVNPTGPTTPKLAVFVPAMAGAVKYLISI